MSANTDDRAEPVKASPSNWSLIRRMLGLAWHYRWGCIQMITLHLSLQVLMLAGLNYLGVAVDYLNWRLLGDQKEPSWPLGFAPPGEWSGMQVMFFIAGLLVAMTITHGLLGYFATVKTADLVNKQIVVDLRARVYDKMQRLSFRFFDANASGSIINRVTGDVQAVRMFIELVVIQIAQVAISLTIALTYMFSKHVMLTLACMASTPVLWALAVWFSRIVRPAYMKNRELEDDMVLRVSENLQGVRVVKGFARQEDQVEWFGEANNKVKTQKRWIFWRMSGFIPTIHLFTHLNLVVLVGYGGYLAATEQIAIGTGLLVFWQLLRQFSNQVGMIAQIANSVQQSLVGAERVFEVLDEPVEIASPDEAVELGIASGCVKFDNVTFGYDREAPVLEEVSFVAKPGECIAILGATGSGKSTLLSLIPRFYDIQEGSVRVDGHDVRDLDLDQLRRSIGLVFQESFLFSNTVAANIAFGHPEATRDQIERAAKVAAAHEFIEQLPKGYDSVIAEGGSDLSGGQRQRLAIARAVLLEPRILLMDDPTAAIDPETEDEILRAMDSAMEGRTTFVVAHRLSTLRRSDRVIVLQKGRIVQVGTHEELMKTKGHYRWAANSQIADERSRSLLGMEIAGGEI